MKAKPILWIVLALLFGYGWGGIVQADGIRPGTEQDPLVTKSYVDDYIAKSFIQLPDKLAAVNNSFAKMETDIQQVKEKMLPFTDIRKHWALDNIIYLYNQKIINGFSDGTFGPNQQVTRAQLAVMLVRALNLPIPEGESPFKDLPQNHWATKEVIAAKEAGIISGYTDGTFQPNKNVNRAELATMLVRAYKLQAKEGEFPFGDITPNNYGWAQDYIKALFDNGITTGYPNNVFKPGNSATRAEVAAFLNRVMQPTNRLTNF